MVVDESTICLMSHERKLVLDLIMKLAKHVSNRPFEMIRILYLQTLAALLRQEGYNIETSQSVVQPMVHSVPVQLPIKLSKKARRKLKKNKALAEQQAALCNHIHYQQSYQPQIVPFVTYSKVEDIRTQPT